MTQDNVEEVKEQKPFKIDMTFPTSEMLGKHILGKLETTQAWVIPIYDGEPEQISQLFPQTLDDEELREKCLLTPTEKSQAMGKAIDENPFLTYPTQWEREAVLLPAQVDKVLTLLQQRGEPL